MTLRTLIISLFSFVLGATLFASDPASTSFASRANSSVIENNRTADREAIRAHLDSIFRAYVNKDLATIRATHARNWTGFLLSSRSLVRGLEEYMSQAEAATKNPLLIADYKLADIDFIFYGDVALVPYVAEVIAGSTLRLPAKFRSLDIYAKVDGKWIQVGSNIDFHPETLEAQRQQLMPLSPALRKDLLNAREAVWRAYFANDRTVLERVIPEETVAINAGADAWDNRKAVFEGASQFAQAGGKLLRIEFPKTEVQLYGDVAILYSTYLYELSVQGKSLTQTGRATETFVRRNGTWVNPGWHLDSGK